MPTSSASSREITPTPCVRISEERVALEHLLVFVDPLLDQVDRLPALRRPSLGHVVAHAADLMEAVEQARAGQRLEQIQDQLALADAVEKDRRAAAERAAHVHAPRAEPEAVRRDALQFGDQHAQVLRALRHLDLRDPLGGHHVRQLARHRGDVVGLRRDRRVLRVGQRLGQLLVAAVQVADHRIDADDRLAFERENRAEHAVRRRVLRAHVHRQPLAAGVVQRP